MRTRRCTLLTFVALLTVAITPVPAVAQPANPFSVAVRANIAPSAGGTSAVVGGSATYALTERLAVEAEGIYFATSDVTETWGVALNTLFAVGPRGWSDDLVPFVVAGVGLERATVTHSGRDLPDFYARRLGNPVVPADGRRPEARFTDPVLTLGGGLRFTGPAGVFVQPEARIWLAMADGDTAASGLFGLTVGYRFKQF